MEALGALLALGGEVAARGGCSAPSSRSRSASSTCWCCSTTGTASSTTRWSRRTSGISSRCSVYFCLLAAIFIVVSVYATYLEQMLQMRWRIWLTRQYLGDWLGDQVYYRLELEHRGTDNPDQRIQEDLRLFTDGTLCARASGCMREIVTLGVVRRRSCGACPGSLAAADRRDRGDRSPAISSGSRSSTPSSAAC